MHARTLQRMAPWLWLTPAGALLIPFFVIPLLLTARNSVYYDDPVGMLVPAFTFTNYTKLLQDPYYFAVFKNTLGAASCVCLISIVVSYPLSWILARANGGYRIFLLWAVYLPIYVSVIMRVFGWIVVLSDGGLLNKVLIQTGAITHPLEIMNNFPGMIVGLVHRYLPIMILPLATSLRKIDAPILKAAANLGGGRWFIWSRVILPMSLPGIVIGTQLVFAGVISDYVIPSLMGSPKFQMFAPAIFYEGTTNASWALSGAMATLVVIIVAAFLVAANTMMRRAAPWASL